MTSEGLKRRLKETVAQKFVLYIFWDSDFCQITFEKVFGSSNSKFNYFSCLHQYRVIWFQTCADMWHDYNENWAYRIWSKFCAILNLRQLFLQQHIHYRRISGILVLVELRMVAFLMDVLFSRYAVTRGSIKLFVISENILDKLRTCERNLF